MDRLKVLITSANWKASLAVMKSLARKGADISLLSDDRNTPALYSKYCKKRIISPNECRKKEYTEFLINMLKDGNYDLLIPISESTVYYCSELRDEILKYARLILPSHNSILVAHNKVKTYQFSYVNDIPIPKTFFPASLSDVESISSRIFFPCITKNPFGAGGVGNKLILSKDELVSLYRNKADSANWPVIQEIVEGKTFSFAGFCSKGYILGYFMCEKLRQFPETGGITVYGKSSFNSNVLRIAQRVIEKLNWTGPISYDFILTKNNECFLIDINPRFPGNLQFSYECGIDLPNFYFNLINNKSFKEDIVSFPSYKINIIYRSIFMEELLSCKYNHLNYFSLFFNFFRLNIRHDYSFADPILLSRQMKKVMISILKHNKGNFVN